MRATTIFAVTLLCAVCRQAAQGVGDAQPRPAARRAHEPTFDAGTDAAGTASDSSACLLDADCRAPGRRGRCFTPELAAQYTQAFRDCSEAQAWRASHTTGTCVYDECRPAEEGRSADSCPDGQRCGSLEMAPIPQRVCVPAACESDMSCRRQVGGRCASFLSGGRCQRGGWACSYPRDECAPRDPHRMCPIQRGAVPFCAPRDGRFTCVQEPVTQPESGT